MPSPAYEIGILDEDAAYRSAMSRLLVAHGHVARAYSTAGACLRAAGHRRLDCLLLDLYLSDMTVFEIPGVLKRQLPDTPLIIVSTCDEPELGAYASAMGAAASLRKPVRAATLLHAIGIAVAARSQVRGRA